MEPVPVQQGRTPTYPTRREVLAGAATFTLASLAGCWPALVETEQASAIVAPIFEHGDGRGATGCVVISPPVFLSEEEAMQIIREELAGHGIQLKEGVVLEGVRIPQRFRDYESEKSRRVEADGAVIEGKKDAKLMKLQGVDAEKKVGVEFVSKRRYFDLGGVQESYSSDEVGYVSSTVQEYDFKETAEFVAANVKKQSKQPIYIGVFYDPQWEAKPVTKRCNNPADSRKELEELTSALDALNKPREQRQDAAKKLLRLQAQDFVAWLKKNKAIK